ncbi:KEOPS complex Pcc1-like subunit [Halovenus sp. WSH3]|uniref:KEOPS complex Pcc1-like subunit n=1 Tax=Halovenus carboxidivorans TaxID=2692199 RepID=A0A6B0T497_9EURY|nr:KEOPS complex Pcc1-like subunit [Halovenus carboxidivorans]
MVHEAVLSFQYDSPEQAARVADAIDPELGEIDDDRSGVRADRDGSALELTVEAEDLVAMRAAINTWCSLVDVAERAGATE